MKTLIALAVLSAAAAAPCLASAGEIRFKDVVAEIRVIPENRGDLQVNVTRTYPCLPAFKISRTANGGLLVGGGLYKRIRACGTFGGISIKDGPRVPRNQVPQIVVRAPL